MGVYVNPDAERFIIDKNDTFYVDKSGLIACLNRKLNTNGRFFCVTRPRRFGKSMAANMIAAYYSKGADSRALFSGMRISDDPSFDRYLNKFNVIKMDLNGAITTKGNLSVAGYYNSKILPELRLEFASVNLPDEIPLSWAIQKIYAETNEKFIFIIDEYDIIIRDER